jgi:hypothetical protein
MRRCAFLSLLVLLAGRGSVSFGVQSNGTHIEGVVLDGVTERPIPAVIVQIAELKLSTDMDGRFSFDAIPPGRYTLLADKSGYLRARPEGRKTGNSGIILTIDKGQASQAITIHMFRGGAVTGRIDGADGTPLQGMVVIPYRAVYDNDGNPILMRSGTNGPASAKESQWSTGLAQVFLPSLQAAPPILPAIDPAIVAAGFTNNLGEFRIANIEPGRYGFYVVPGFPGASQLPEYYPGVANAASAYIVNIESGNEIRLNTVTMAIDTPAKLRVQVMDRTGQAGATAFVQVFRKGGSDVLYQWPILRPGSASCEKDPAACNDIGNFSVGNYEIEAVVWSRRGLFAASNRVPFQMSGSDVRLDVPVSSGAVSNVNFTVPSGLDGSFKIHSIPSGLYRVRGVSGVPAGLCLDELRQDDRNVLRAGLVATGAGIPLNAKLVESQIVLHGKVNDENGVSVGGAIVALVPDDRSRTEAYATAVTDQNGAFEMSCVRQGEYHLFSWIELEGAAYRNADFMKPYDGQGQSVIVPDSGTLTVNAKLLR